MHPRPETTESHVLCERLPTLQGAASDMCQSHLFALLKCLKALQLGAAQRRRQGTVISHALLRLLQESHSSDEMGFAYWIGWLLLEQRQAEARGHRPTPGNSFIRQFCVAKLTFIEGVFPRTAALALQNPLLAADPACLYSCLSASSGGQRFRCEPGGLSVITNIA